MFRMASLRHPVFKGVIFSHQQRSKEKLYTENCQLVTNTIITRKPINTVFKAIMYAKPLTPSLTLLPFAFRYLHQTRHIIIGRRKNNLIIKPALFNRYINILE